VNIRNRVKELRHVPASDLRPNPKNWRTHPTAQRDALRGILAEVGMADAVLARELPDGSLMLIDGHLRAETAAESKVPVLVLDVNEAEADKLLATLDPLAAMADSDAAKLDELLRNVDTGSEALQQLLASTADAAGLYQDAEQQDIIEDEAPEPPVDPITKPGDLWLLGDHRLLCGDSTKVNDVNVLMKEQTWQLMATSPPYNQGNSSGDLLTNGGKAVSLYHDKTADNMESADYEKFCVSVLVASLDFADKESHCVCWNVAYNAKSRSEYGRVLFGEENPYSVKETIVWDKGHSINLPQIGIYSRRCEFVFVMSASVDYRTSQTYNDCRWNYWAISNNKSQTTNQNIEHRAAFPIALPVKMMTDFSIAGDAVYEPFCGSGTTLIAAEQLGRKCYGMEISPAYCDVIVKRWETLTGKKATREAN